MVTLGRARVRLGLEFSLRKIKLGFDPDTYGLRLGIGSGSNIWVRLKNWARCRLGLRLQKFGLGFDPIMCRLGLGKDSGSST